MAQRKGGSVAPVRQKLRKNHGPKRHMFKDYKPMVKAFADAGLLSKYDDPESFALACTARGVKNGIKEMWSEFCILPREKQKEYFSHLKEHSAAAVLKSDQKKKVLKKSKEIK